MTADQNAKTKLHWTNINSDEMRPAKSKEVSKTSPNLPHVDGSYAKFGDHISDFIAGFEAYAKFLRRQTQSTGSGRLFDGFAGLPIRKVLRPTQFYYLLLQRLKDHRAMEDGAIWSAQADFIARLVDWDKDSDPLWPLQRRERAALLALNVPHFVSPSDRTSIEDASGFAVRTQAIPGLDRARARVESLDDDDIAWQIDVIRHSTSALSRSEVPPPPPALSEPFGPAVSAASAREIFTAEADRIAAELSRQAIRRGPGAAWIGLDWLGDSEVFQLVCLGPDLYNGVSGISLFLAAHAAATGCGPSAELALAGVAHLRKDLRSRNAPRIARSLGIGAAAGLGSIVYALTAMAKSLDDDGLLADAHVAAELFSDELIAADQRLDVIAGSAGAILGLLRLYRDTRSGEVLARATKCGEHLLRPEADRAGGSPELDRSRIRPARRSMACRTAPRGLPMRSLCWRRRPSARNSRKPPPNALRSRIRATIRVAATGPICAALSRPGYANGVTELSASAWRASPRAYGEPWTPRRRPWISETPSTARNVAGRAQWIRFAAGRWAAWNSSARPAAPLGKSDLGELASQRLLAVLQAAAAAGDYRWNSGRGRFNLGLFRGLAGVGYTLLRRIDSSLPNVLIWE